MWACNDVKTITPDGKGLQHETHCSTRDAGRAQTNGISPYISHQILRDVSTQASSVTISGVGLPPMYILYNWSWFWMVYNKK